MIEKVPSLSPLHFVTLVVGRSPLHMLLYASSSSTGWEMLLLYVRRINPNLCATRDAGNVDLFGLVYIAIAV